MFIWFGCGFGLWVLDCIVVVFEVYCLRSNDGELLFSEFTACAVMTSLDDCVC